MTEINLTPDEGTVTDYARQLVDRVTELVADADTDDVVVKGWETLDEDVMNAYSVAARELVERVARDVAATVSREIREHTPEAEDSDE